jgi:catechol 2,3-dioxygenase-like lactoylglutathione lyase family enzyme
LAIGKDDIRYANDTIKVRVHSLGSLDASVSTLLLVQGDSIVTSSSVPALSAPIDLISKFVDVTLSVPKNIDLKKCSVRIDPGVDVIEITDFNNHVELSENIKMNITENQKTEDDQNVVLKNQPRLEHMAFNVKDPVSIAQWYCDHLGMKIVRKTPDNTYFISDDAGTIAIEFYHNADVPVLDYASMNHMSLHLAFMVDDVNAMKASLLTAGATLVDDTTTTTGGDQVLMLRDPWGLAIQLVKRISPMLHTVGIRPEHLAFNVSDPQRMTNWYIENLGMKIVREDTSPNYTSFFTGENRNMMLELFNNAAYPMLNMKTINHRSMHVAFIVDDVLTIRNALIAAGATLAEDIKISGEGDEILMLRDPWGVPIQCVKRGKPMLK